MKVLIIEDQQELAASILAYLARENFVCEAAYDFETAREKVNSFEYSCIVLDISLPLGNGLNILQELKARNKSDGVLIISARNSLDDKILGLNLGADDYLTKPFHLPELAARVNAIIRRMALEGRNRIDLGALSLDLRDKIVRGENGIIELTRKEYDLLVYLMGNLNKVVTKEAIVAHLWGDTIDMADNYDFIYAHIKNLRKKLLLAGCPDYIKAIYGMGYKFSATEEKRK
jgi:DNA-binding response OmpR family regulator